ncbi:response regulator transcription factor [Lujinxingia sediminis]|uniref:Response regulator transcription factor n=1 Tax=Lujinxingia sediminis TaxID=2480984 RepID=A0ABY0CND6_9DELT|nr:response regulator transcription factor [Lujinxingia sediminis]RVU41077.1 response regulator transcription factor [Lujinxingia sediminis]
MNINTLDPEHTTNAGQDRRRLILFLAIFLLVSILAGLDLLADLSQDASPVHLAIEGLLVLGGLFGSFSMMRALHQTTQRIRQMQSNADALRTKLRARARETRALNEELSQTRAQAQQWQREARDLMRGLSLAIDQQFDRWELTEAEKEVAILLLKGLSHKEIAALRQTSDATTRQQARAVYKKGQLSGRNELAAFFLEDLLLPLDAEALDEAVTA